MNKELVGSLNGVDFIVLGIVLILVGAAIYYLYKQKKNGAKCIGCSMSGTCASKSRGGCDCEKPDK